MINIQIASRISDKYLFFFVVNNRDKKNDKKIPIVNMAFIRGCSCAACYFRFINYRFINFLNKYM